MDYRIRVPQLDDAPGLQTFINTLSAEKTYITYQGEQVSLEQERDYVAGLLSQIKHHQCIALVVAHHGVIVGSGQVTLKPRTQQHVGILGISIAADHRGQGLGSRLLTALISTAKQQLPTLRLITLSVLANNYQAIYLYTKYGFKEYGRLPSGTRYRQEYVDLIDMYLNVGRGSES